jgi:hypothetical protein
VQLAFENGRRPAANVEVIRAEANEGSEPGCVYNVQGDISDLVAKHASLMQKEGTTEAQRQQFESVAKGLFQGMNKEQTGSTSKHPGEAPVFIFSVSNAGAKAQMNLSRMASSRMYCSRIGRRRPRHRRCHDAGPQRRQTHSHHVSDVPLQYCRRDAARERTHRKYVAARSIEEPVLVLSTE